MKGSFLRRNGSFGGRSKITHTLTSGIVLAQSPCRTATRHLSMEIHEVSQELIGIAAVKVPIVESGGSVYREWTTIGINLCLSLKIRMLRCPNSWTVFIVKLGHDGALAERRVGATGSIHGFSPPDRLFT